MTAGVAALAIGATLPLRSELLGLRKERALTLVDGSGAVVRISGSAATAAPFGAFSLHIGTILDGALRFAGRLRAANREYRATERREDGPEGHPHADDRQPTGD